MTMFGKFEQARSVSSSDGKKTYTLGCILAGMVVMQMISDDKKKKTLAEVLGHTEYSVGYKFFENKITYKDGKSGKTITTTRSIEKYFLKNPGLAGCSERVSVDEGFKKLFADFETRFVSQDDVIVRACIWLVDRSLEVDGVLREKIDTLMGTASQNCSLDGQLQIGRYLVSKGLLTQEDYDVMVPAVEVAVEG